MTAVWVDTDMGFDDLWALLLLRHRRAPIAGISLTAGNAALAQVIANARGAEAAYGIGAPLFAGAAKPLVRGTETAERILGPTGMRSRGRVLPAGPPADPPPGALGAMADWLLSAAPGAAREMLAIGPLTTLAQLLRAAPEAARRITRLVWMGGARAGGNHSPRAEFNALADPEAATLILASGLRIDVVDLTLCRSVTFGEADRPATDPLTADLLGGYLDIALSRGRDAMALYDPLAALALLEPDGFDFAPVAAVISTRPDESYGETRFAADPASPVRLASRAPADAARRCLAALVRSADNGA